MITAQRYTTTALAAGSQAERVGLAGKESFNVVSISPPDPCQPSTAIRTTTGLARSTRWSRPT